MRKPVTSPVNAETKSGTGSRADVESAGSAPAIAESAIAVSATVRPKGPIWSSDDANARSP
jgi:hypothetical protein